MNENLKITCEWYIYDQDGDLIEGPLNNYVTSAGLAAIAAGLQAVTAPYLVIGDDTTAGETISETYRKACSFVSRSGPIVSFRTQLFADEGNGDHNKTCIYIDASNTPGTGTMLNLLTAPWSKTNKILLTIEARFTISN